MTGMTRRWWPAVALAPVLAMSVGLVGPGPARADVPVTKVGWWTRSPQPPSVPTGGIAVGDAPDGYLSVAAISLDTGGGASGAHVTLAESDGQGQQAASLQACPTSDKWSPANGDGLASAPRPQCNSSSPTLLTRDSSGNWTADLTPLLAGQTGSVSIMIVPGPPAAALPGSTETQAFQVSFSPPKVDGTVAPASDTSSSSASDSSFGAGAGTSTVASDTGSATSLPAATTYSIPSTPTDLSTPSVAAPTPPPAQPSPAPAATPAPAASTAGGGQFSFPIRTAGAHTKPKSRLVILAWVALSCLVGAAAAGWRWAQQEGVFERVALFGRGTQILPPVS